MRHLLTLTDVSTAEIHGIFQLADRLKDDYERGHREPRFPGHVMALLFAKPSLRTRVSFEAAMAHLGGHSLYLGKEVGWGERESDADFSRVLSCYADIIVCRTVDHDSVERLALESRCPVINGLTSVEHPCQALADLYTLRQQIQRLEQATLTYIGDGNNVARSLAVACCHFNVRFAMAAPPGYQLSEALVAQLKRQFPDARLFLTDDPAEAVRDANVVYTDVWSSMGQEAEQEERRRAFAQYQVNKGLMDKAPKDARFMHCLPAHRGEEVTNDVIDGPRSAVIQQAANRLHVQKGIVAWLLDEARR